MFEVDQRNIVVGLPKYKNITGNAYNVNNKGVITLYSKNSSKVNMNKEQFEYRKNMIIRLIQRSIENGQMNRDKSKDSLRKSLQNVNIIANLPFPLFTAAFSELIKNRIISPTRDAKLIGSFYRIFADFHDEVAEDGDQEVKQKLQMEADKYHKLSTFGQLSKMLKGGTRKKRQQKRKTIRRVKK